MPMNFGDVRYPKSKPAPVLFGIDVTASMTWPMDRTKKQGISRMEMANNLIRRFISHLLTVPKAAGAVEVAFVLFAHDIVLETKFVRLNELSAKHFQEATIEKECWKGITPWKLETITDPQKTVIPRFDCCNDKGSKVDSAILKCYNKILNYINTKDMYIVDDNGNKRALFYAPHFVLITDGDPDDGNSDRMRDDAETHRQAKNMIYDHCYTGRDGMNLVVPITVGVFGSEITEDAIMRVNDYAEHFKKGFFRVESEKAPEKFDEAAQFLCNTVVKSLSLGWDDPNPGANDDTKKKGKQDDPRGKPVDEIFGE